MEKQTERFIARPNETTLDMANRIMMEIFLPTLASRIIHNKPAKTHRTRGHIMGIYVQAQAQNKLLLVTLLKARDRLRESFVWTINNEGEWQSQEFTSTNYEVFQAWNEANLAFVNYVKSWQPVMDAIATLVQLALEVFVGVKFERQMSMTELSKKAKTASWPQTSDKLRQALIEGAEWYLNKVRIMRNQFVHNSRVAFLLPVPESQHTNVQIKELERDETIENFDLSKFISYMNGKYLLFCVDVIEGVDALS